MIKRCVKHLTTFEGFLDKRCAVVRR